MSRKWKWMREADWGRLHPAQVWLILLIPLHHFSCSAALITETLGANSSPSLLLILERSSSHQLTNTTLCRFVKQNKHTHTRVFLYGWTVWTVWAGAVIDQEASASALVWTSYKRASRLVTCRNQPWCCCFSVCINAANHSSCFRTNCFFLFI